MHFRPRLLWGGYCVWRSIVSLRRKKVQPTLWVASSFALLPRVGALHLPTLRYRKYNPDGVMIHHVGFGGVG